MDALAGAMSPRDAAVSIVLADDPGRLRQRDTAREVLRAAFTETRRLLQEAHGLDGPRIDSNTLELVTHACAGRRAATRMADNFRSRLSIWTGQAKDGFGVVEYLRVAEEELLAPPPAVEPLEPARAQLGLGLVRGVAVVYNKICELTDRRRRPTDWDVFKEAVETSIPKDMMAEVIASGGGSLDTQLGPTWDSIQSGGDPGFIELMEGTLATGGGEDADSGERGWFEHSVLRLSVAASSVPSDTAWKVVTFTNPGDTGLRLLQVTMKTTGQNWLVVLSVKDESVASNKRVKVGMMLYRFNGRCAVGLSRQQYETLGEEMRERPLTLEFASHLEHLEGDWRYEQVQKELAEQEDEEEEDHSIPIGWATTRRGLHRRKGGNPAFVQKERDDAKEAPEHAGWRDNNPYLNGEHKRHTDLVIDANRRKREAEENAPLVPDPDKPIITGRSLGLIGPEQPRRLQLLHMCWSPQMDNFLLVCILINAFMLAVQAPQNNLDEQLGFAANDWINRLDTVLSVIFSVEMVCKIYCLGLLVGPTTYLRSRWNMIDFAVVIGIWGGWILQAAGRELHDISFLRTLRALRPLRSMRYFKGVKRIMTSLNESSGVLLGVTVLLFFCYTVLSCIGVLLYAGGVSRTCAVRNEFARMSWTERQEALAMEAECPQYHTPNQTGWLVSEDCPRTVQCHEADVCLVVPKYKVSDENPNGTYTGVSTDELEFWGFDHAGTSYLTLFIVTTLDEWPALSDPLRNSDLRLSNTVWYYFAFTVLATGTVVANLFIAVVTLAFARAREAEGGGGFTGDDFKKLAEDARLEADRIRELEEELAHQDDEVVEVTGRARRRMGDVDGDAEVLKVRRKHHFPHIPGLSPVCRTIAASGLFEGFIMLVVIFNTGTMMMEHHNMTDEYKKTLADLEVVCTVIYVFEVLIKIFGLGLKPYFRGPGSGFNILDFTLVMSALATYLIEFLRAGGEEKQGSTLMVGRMLRMLRLFRAARLIKVLKKHESVMMLINTVLSSWSAILNVCLFIAILVCILAIMGLQLYGADVPGWEAPREHFQTFPRAVLTVYQIFTGEDWSPIMFAYMHAFGPSAALYFVLTFIVTNFALANLFVAVILENFAVAEHLKPQKQEEQYNKQERAKQMLSPRKQVATQASASAIRKKCALLMGRVWFSDGVMAAIVVSTFALMAEGPPMSSTHYLDDFGCEYCQYFRRALEVTDIALFFLFWCEALIKIIALGPYRRAKNAPLPDPLSDEEEEGEAEVSVNLAPKASGYFADPWNRLDFFIVLATTVDFVTARMDLGEEYELLGVVRTFRVLRPLRMVQHHENIRIVLEALLASAGAVSATLALAAFCFVVFIIIALNLFMGRLWHCGPDESLDRLPCEAMYGNMSWVNRPDHFDDYQSAFRSLFVVATLEGWVEIMNWCLDIPELPDMAPVHNYSEENALFFIIFTLLGGFFITNLFVGVLVEEFQQSSGSALMTEEQEKWARFELMCHIADTTETKMDPETIEMQKARMRNGTCLYSKLPLLIFSIAHSPLFDTIITAAILVNVGTMLLESYPQPAWMMYGLETFEVSFMLLFTLELFVNGITQGWGKYWASNWTKLDVGVVVSSWVLTYLGIPAGTQALRSMRVLKLILKYDQGISRSIVQTIVMSISPALNVTVATTLITVIYAVMGMQLYGNLPQCEGNKINESQNFADIFHAMQFLYQIATGQDFITVVRELDEVHDAPAPFFYFFTFYILSIFVFLNLFVAVLLEKFESEFGVSEDDDDEEEVDGFSITKQELIRFRDIWERHTRRHARLEHKVANRSFFQK